MPKITADIPEELYRFVRGKIVDQRLEGESTTVTTLVTELLYKWKNGLALVTTPDSQQLRRRRGAALASDPIEELAPDSQPVEATTIGQDIDKELEGLSQEECDILREILVPQVRQLKHLIKLPKGE